MSPWLMALIMVVLFGLGWLIWLLWTARSLKQAVEHMTYVTTLKAGGARVEDLYPTDGNTVDISKDNGKIGSIVLDPTNTFNMLYPPGGGWPPKFVRATVRSTVVAEGNAEPYAPFAKEPIMSDEKLNAIKQQAFTRDAIHKGYEQFKDRMQAAFPINKVYLYIIIGLIMLFCLMAAILAYMAYAEAESLSGAFGM